MKHKRNSLKECITRIVRSFYFIGFSTVADCIRYAIEKLNRPQLKSIYFRSAKIENNAKR